MGGLFGGSKPSVAPLPPPPPTVDEAANTAEAQDKLRKRRGVAANIIAGADKTGAGGKPQTASSVLLGQ